MSEVGSLYIKMSAETAELRGDLGKVKQQLADLADGAKSGSTGIDTSMAKARGSLMLVESAVGVRLPRALNTLIAGIPAVGEAFSVMLPLAGIVAAIAAIGKLIDAHEKEAEAIRKAGDEANNMAIKQAGQAKSLELTNLKLDDQIAKLEHKPAHNFLAEAMIETSDEVDKLAATYAADFEKMNDVVQTHLSFWTELKTFAKEAIATNASFALASSVVQKQALQSLQDKMVDVEKARRALAEAPLTDSAQKTAQLDLLTKLKAQAKAFDEAAGASAGNKEMLMQFSSSAASTASEIRNLNAAIEAGSKRKVVANLEQKNANLEPLKDEAELQRLVATGVEQHSQALIKLADSQAKATATASSKGGDDNIDARLSLQKAAIAEEEKATIASAQAELQAKMSVYAADVKAASGNTEKKKELAQTMANEQQAFADAVLVAQADANSKSVQAEATADEERRKLAEGLAQSKAALDRAYATVSESISMAAIKHVQDANDRASALGLESEKHSLAAKIAVIEQERDAKLHAIQQEIDAERAAAEKSGANGDRAKQNEDLAKAAQLQAQLNAQTADYASQISKVTTDIQKLNSTWATYFSKMKVETQDLSTQIRTKLQASVTEFETSFANSMARCIVENKSLGQAVRQVAGQMLESMISMLVQWLEKWVITHIMAAVTSTATGKTAQLAAAQLAGANMVASYSAAPWPIDMAAPAMGATAFAAAMSFETGGKIPGSGVVPINAHGGESVVQKVLTDRVESAERHGGVKGGGGDMHLHFAPSVHAMDAEGVDRVLTKHATTFERHFRATVRRMNK